MAALYIVAGTMHFLHPQLYLRIMPPWLPSPIQLIWISGACEIVFGVLLVPRFTRRAAAWLIIALLIAVFPANIQMLLDWYRTGHSLLWIAWMRLPAQILLIFWAWSYTKLPAKNR